MKIVLVGGGTGGHFYPLISIAEALQDLAVERKLLEPELFYLGPTPFDERALLEHDIEYVPSSAGKLHRDRTVGNALGFFATFFGIIRAIFQLFRLYPDMIFSTGGYAAFPTLYAAKLLKIPVAIFDPDATPGRVSLWSSKFARWIALAHPEAAVKFPEKTRDRIAQTGYPIRKEIETPAKEGGYEFLKLDPNASTVFILGGSQGAVAINEVVLDALPDLVDSYNVIHQAGSANQEEVSRVASVILKDSHHQDRYVPFGLLNTLAMRMSAGIATIVVSRAGSGTIFEVASWGLPAIMIPIPSDISHDQTENAFSYARAGGCVVIEQQNLTPHLLTAEIRRIIDDPAVREKMSQAAKAFAKPQAARKIATVILETALEHEAL